MNKNFKISYFGVHRESVLGQCDTALNIHSTITDFLQLTFILQVNNSLTPPFSKVAIAK